MSKTYKDDNVLLEIVTERKDGLEVTFYIRAAQDQQTQDDTKKRINEIYMDCGESAFSASPWIGVESGSTDAFQFLGNTGIDIGFFYITSSDIETATEDLTDNNNTMSDLSDEDDVVLGILNERIKTIKIHYPYLIFDSNIVKSNNEFNVTIDFSPLNNLPTESYQLLDGNTISLYANNKLFDVSKEILTNDSGTVAKPLYDILLKSSSTIGGVFPLYNSTDEIYSLLGRIKKIIIIYKGEKGLPLNSGAAHSSPNLSFHKTQCLDLGSNNDNDNTLGIIGSSTDVDNIPLFLWEFADNAGNTDNFENQSLPNDYSKSKQEFVDGNRVKELKNYFFTYFSIYDITGITARINDSTETSTPSISVGNPIIGRNNPAGQTFNYNISSSDDGFNLNVLSDNYNSLAVDNLFEDNLVIQGVSVQNAYDELKSSFSREIIGNSIEVPTADSLEIKGGVVGSNAISCFVAEEVVETDQGLVKIKDITKKHSIRGMRVKYLSKITIKHSYIVKINKHALGENRPNKDTLCSPRHGIYLNDNDKRFVVLQKLINNNTITKVDINKNTDLYNILLEDNIHSYMYVNNLKVETLHPSNPSIPIISSKKI